MEFWKSAVILVHFPENNHHGCGKKCSFCYFAKTDYNIPIKPTDKEILDFIAHVRYGGKIQICGAGDPLFNFSQNKNYLLHVIDLIHSKGYKIELVTKYTEVVQEYIDVLSIVDMFCFSIEDLNQDVLHLIDTLTSLNKIVRISKVANFTQDIHDIKWDYIIKYINFYSQIVNKDNFSICLRPNFNFIYDEAEFWKERLKVRKLSEAYGFHIYMHIQGHHVRTPQLWNNRIVACGDTQKYIKIDMGIN